MWRLMWLIVTFISIIVRNINKKSQLYASSLLATFTQTITLIVINSTLLFCLWTLKLSQNWGHINTQQDIVSTESCPISSFLSVLWLVYLSQVCGLCATCCLITAAVQSKDVWLWVYIRTSKPSPDLFSCSCIFCFSPVSSTLPADPNRTNYLVNCSCTIYWVEMSGLLRKLLPQPRQSDKTIPTPIVLHNKCWNESIK